MQTLNASHGGSVILPFYESGKYFATHSDPDQDAPFKVQAFLNLFGPIAGDKKIHIRSYADVGCGGGGTAALLAQGLRDSGHTLETARGYDVAPQVKTLHHPGVEFIQEDFCSCQTHADLVTLFDVVEHVPDPMGLLKAVAARCDFVGLHIPLDNSLANILLNRFEQRLAYPGHLIFLDPVSALNLVTMSGILTLGYRYTLGYAAPSGTHTLLQKIAFPFRAALATVSPWIASRTIGGVSLMIFGATSAGIRRISQ